MSAPISNIHDAFFKQALSDPSSAHAFLQEHLPSDVVRLFSPEPPVQMPGSFVDENLAQHHSDLLFRVRLITGNPALAYVLLEHKSRPDSGTRLQLLRYVVRILTQWSEQNDPQLPLPPVISLVAHQGPKRWSISSEFSHLFGEVPEPLRPYLVSFRHGLVDLPRIDDGALSSQLRLRSFLKALKYMRRRDLAEHLELLFAEASELSPEDLLRILRYIDQSPLRMSKEIRQHALNRMAPHQRENTVGLFSELFIDEGIEKGLQQGIQKGRTEGEAKALIRLLERRFGGVSPSHRERILAADLTQIEAWFELAVDAHELRAVFESN